MESIQWQINVPIFRNEVILKQLGIAVGIPFGLLAVLLVLFSGNSVYTLYALGLIGALLFFTWIFVMAVYGGEYELEFFLDEKAVFCRTRTKQAMKNKMVNTLTVVLGIITGKPAAAGAGILAGSRQSVCLRWDGIVKASYKPRSRTIMVRGGWTESMGIFCTKENYVEVEKFVSARLSHRLKNRERFI